MAGRTPLYNISSSLPLWSFLLVVPHGCSPLSFRPLSSVSIQPHSSLPLPAFSRGACMRSISAHFSYPRFSYLEENRALVAYIARVWLLLSSATPVHSPWLRGQNHVECSMFAHAVMTNALRRGPMGRCVTESSSLTSLSFCSYSNPSSISSNFIRSSTAAREKSWRPNRLAFKPRLCH